MGVVADVGGDPGAADLVVAGPDALEAGLACSGERVALSLAPLGRRFTTPPAGYADYAVEVPSQGDRFQPYAPVEPEEAALIVAGAERTGAEVVERARAEAAFVGSDGTRSRILSALPLSASGGAERGVVRAARLRGVRGALSSSGATGEDALAKRIESERVTSTVRSSPSPWPPGPARRGRSPGASRGAGRL